MSNLKETHLVKFNHYGKPVNVLLVYPNKYSIGIYSTGHQSVYRMLNESENINCERLYYESGSTNFKSIETGHYPEYYDIIAFSISYELDIFNIIDFLEKRKIPVKPEERKDCIILAGGSLTLINSRLLNSIGDIVIKGDIEDIISCIDKDFIQVSRMTRQDFIAFIKSRDYSWNIEKEKNNTAHHIRSYSNIITGKGEFKNTFLVEMVRGCNNKCGFCVTGHNRGKIIEFDFEEFKQLIEKYRDFFNRSGLIGSAILSIYNIEDILDFLLEKKLKFTLSSVDLRCLKESLIEKIIEGSQEQLTIAPETASMKLQRLINKGLNPEKIMFYTGIAQKAGLRKLKLYFLYGFEKEENKDMDESIELVKKIKSQGYHKISVSINPFIPKKNTPLAKVSMQPPRILKKKRLYLIKEFNKIKGVRCSGLGIREAELQYRIACSETLNDIK